MAKIRHRIFEMFEFREEAIDALARRSAQAVIETEVPEPRKLKHLAVSRSAGVSLVEFKKGKSLGEETEKELREDLAQFADGLTRDSKVLFDFTGVTSISAANIDALAHFRMELRTKGSRIVLCCISPDVREPFFARATQAKIDS